MNFDLFFYWKLFLRRLPVMMLFILLCSGLGVITALKLPETYSTTARLLVEEPQIPSNMVASTVQTNADEQLDIIQQRLLTRANLIDIANQFQVFPDIGKMNPDMVFEQMERATTIRRAAGRNRATVMTIRFEGRSGQVAANVVNELVTLVLEANSSFRISRAESTLDFFRQEVQRLGEELNRQSARIAEFKSENAEALPEGQRYRLDRAALLQERMAQLQRDLDAIETQRQEVVRIYERTGQVRQQADAPARTPEEERLAAVQAELGQALSVYSETHPRIVQLRSQVERLEEAVQNQTALRQEEEEADQQERQSPSDMIYQTTLADIDTRAESIEAAMVRIQSELEKLQQASAESAANGIELATLERNYENVQRRYNTALNNLDAAQMSERIESTAQGQRITVIENANIPQSPSGPNRPLVAMTGGAIGVMLAGAYLVLLELLNRTIRRPKELTQKFNIVPIAVVPYMESRGHRLMRRSLRVAAVLAILIAVPMGLWYVDTNYVPLDLLVQRGLARLGLG